MPKVPPDIVKAYTSAFKWMSGKLEGLMPSEFKIYYSNRFFPVLLRSEAIRLTGSPVGLLSTSEERSLQKGSKSNISTVQHYLTTPGRGYICGSEKTPNPLGSSFDQSQFVRLLAAFFLGENSLRNVSAKNDLLLQMDHNISSLLTRAISLSPVGNRSWTSQYFRDLAAFIIRFSIIPTHTFHEPLASENTPYTGFLREIIPYAKKRARIWESIPLHQALLNGFMCLCVRKFQNDTMSNLAKSEGYTGKVIADVLESNFHSFQEIIDESQSWESDKDLLESIQLTKFEHAMRENTTSREPRNLVEYLQAVSELSLETNSELWEWKPDTDRYLGFLQGKAGPIYFYELFKTQIAPEQLLILHNHAKPLDDPHSLPSTASIVTFRKTKRQKESLASYFRPEISAETVQPRNPWDFPYYVNSVISSSLIGIEQPEWDNFLVDTWLSKEDLERIGLNDDQLACTMLLLKGKTIS
ncbi:MAG: hypothetical protein ACXAB4_03045 [Candidatus Hodarchaeales archaeon]